MRLSLNLGPSNSGRYFDFCIFNSSLIIRQHPQECAPPKENTIHLLVLFTLQFSESLYLALAIGSSPVTDHANVGRQKGPMARKFLRRAKSDFDKRKYWGQCADRPG